LQKGVERIGLRFCVAVLKIYDLKAHMLNYWVPLNTKVSEMVERLLRTFQ
jgi:hypothetical protein